MNGLTSCSTNAEKRRRLCENSLSIHTFTLYRYLSHSIYVYLTLSIFISLTISISLYRYVSHYVYISHFSRPPPSVSPQFTVSNEGSPNEGSEEGVLRWAGRRRTFCLVIGGGAGGVCLSVWLTVGYRLVSTLCYSERWDLSLVFP